MRIALLLSFVLAACTAPNPNICCATEAQCAALGVTDGLRPCAVGQACSADYTCVAAQCTSNDDCSASAPICREGICEASCAGDDDCTSVAGRPYCSEAVCVGCTENAQCSDADAPICDSQDQACRGCEQDSECASGVCNEFAGTCAREEDIIYTGTGNDVGSCPKSQPCSTIRYAYSQVGLSGRNVIRLLGGSQPSDANPLDITVPVVFDSAGSSVSKPGSVPWLRVLDRGHVTINGVTIDGIGDEDDPAISVMTGGSLSAGRDAVFNAWVVGAGKMTFTRARIAYGVRCTTGGTLDVRDSIVQRPEEGRQLRSTGCAVTVRSNRFLNTGPQLIASGGLVQVENNLFVSTDALADLILIRSVSQGSYFRFNTVVNATGADSDGTALDCDPTLDVSDNLFAYRSRHPFTYAAGCLAKYSVFDNVAKALPTAPQNSSFVAFSSLFANPGAMDFRLADSSPAKQAADPNATLREDLEHAPRPNPIGTPADVGAFEAP